MVKNKQKKNFFKFKFQECSVSLELFSNIGQSIEFRCFSNETAVFNRIKHTLENGTEEILLSNDHVNRNFERNEIQILKLDHAFIVKIAPVKIHSAGLYTCEDDVSAKNASGHVASIRIHVNDGLLKGYLKVNKSTSKLKMKYL